MEPGAEVAKRFRLERQLGSGGMGSVWAATHLVTHKSVALKFLHEKHDDAGARRRMLREARAACAVQHPNVVAVHDVLEGDDGTPILVMDLLRGESLATKLARERTLTPVDAVAVIRPVLSALSAAHAAGIVHRDLKPDNVFLVDGASTRAADADSGGVGRSGPRDVAGVGANVMILDFGVAKLSGKDAATKETNRLTETGAMIGTPHYMAPEQAFGESDIDARADLWAVGAVLYECLAGVPPTDGQNLGQILKVLASGKILPLGSRAPAVPPGLAAIVDGLLAIEKEARPPSATFVLEQLDALERRHPLTSQPAVEIATAPTHDRPETMALAAQSLSAAAVTSPAHQKRRTTVWIAGSVTALALASAAGIFGGRLRTPTVHASEPVVAAVAPPSAFEAPPPSVPASAPVVAEPQVPTASVAASPAKNGVKARPAKAPAVRSVASSAPGATTAKSTSGPLIVEPTF